MLTRKFAKFVKGLVKYFPKTKNCCKSFYPTVHHDYEVEVVQNLDPIKIQKCKIHLIFPMPSFSKTCENVAVIKIQKRKIQNPLEMDDNEHLTIDTRTKINEIVDFIYTNALALGGDDER